MQGPFPHPAQQMPLLFMATELHSVVLVSFFLFLIFIFYLILIQFFPYNLVPYVSYPPAITKLLSMSMSPVSFLLNPFTPPYPPYKTHQLSFCSPPMSLSPFSLLVQYIHQITHMSKFIWYLSFSDWLISHSIMFSSSIPSVAKGTIFFFFATELYSIV